MAITQSDQRYHSAEVTIFGSTYHVRGDNASEHLQELADLVDAKMNEVARYTATADTAKVAILAALNIADELFRCRRDQEGERETVAEKVTELAGELKAALDG